MNVPLKNKSIVFLVPNDKNGLKTKYESVNELYSFDLADVPHINESKLIKFMECRFLNDCFFTNIGNLLLAMNPFKKLDIEQVLSIYASGSVKSNNPHIFQTAERAYHKLFNEKSGISNWYNQMILINGESGSGKTEIAQQVLKYFAHLDKHPHGSSSCWANNDPTTMGNLILALTPIVEAFGNAATTRNSNSSRVCNMVDIAYSEEGDMEFAYLHCFMLETVRITCQRKREHNFHIFYQIVAGLSIDEKKIYAMDSPTSFRYIQTHDRKVRFDLRDEERYKDLLQALDKCDVSDDQKRELINVCIAILHIGNIDFVDMEAIGGDLLRFSPASNVHVQMAGKLLGVSPDELLLAIAHRSIPVAKGLSMEKYLSQQEALHASDSFSKALYKLLFIWLQTKINSVLMHNLHESIDRSTSGYPRIGVLDMFGFECLSTKNSFEQLCINYANEKLQQHFNDGVFLQEKNLYVREGLAWHFDGCPDNSELLWLLEGRHGLLEVCDEELRLPKHFKRDKDECLLASLCKKFGRNRSFDCSSDARLRGCFTIKHYACDVTYSIRGFLDTNRSEGPAEFTACLSNSSVPFIRALVGSTARVSRKPFALARQSSDLSDSENGALTGTGRRRDRTVLYTFAAQLEELMSLVRSRRSHFVRCVLPNRVQNPMIFDTDFVAKQLRNSGALHALSIFQAGYPTRLDHQAFIVYYQRLVFLCGRNLLVADCVELGELAARSRKPIHWRMCAAKLVELIFAIIHIVSDASEEDSALLKDSLRLGETRVFMRQKAIDLLDRLLRQLSVMAASFLQRVWRCRRLDHTTQRICLLTWLEVRRTKAAQSLRAQIVIQRRMRVFLDMRRFERIRASASLVGRAVRRWLVRRRTRNKWIDHHPRCSVSVDFDKIFPLPSVEETFVGCNEGLGELVLADKAQTISFKGYSHIELPEPGIRIGDSEHGDPVAVIFDQAEEAGPDEQPARHNVALIAQPSRQTISVGRKSCSSNASGSGQQRSMLFELLARLSCTDERLSKSEEEEAELDIDETILQLRQQLAYFEGVRMQRAGSGSDGCQMRPPHDSNLTGNSCPEDAADSGDEVKAKCLVM